MTYNKEYCDYQKGIVENKHHINFVSSKLISKIKFFMIIQPPFVTLIYKIFGKIGYRISGKFNRMIKKVLTPFKRIGVSSDVIVYSTKI